MSTHQTLDVERRGAVTVVTLNRPEVLNAFDATMQAELRDVWRSMRTDDEVRAAVVTGAGDRAFCVGIDRDQPMPAAEGSLFGTSNPFMYDDPSVDLGPKSCDLWKPVVAAVNGVACGGAFYILSEVDVIIAAETSTFSDPHVTYGMAAVYEPVKMLQRMALGDVLRMSLLGAHEIISARTAERIGLVSEVVPPGDLAARALELAETIASQPPAAVQATLRAIWAAAELSPSQALRIAPSILANGVDATAMAEGQQLFESGQRIRPHLR